MAGFREAVGGFGALCPETLEVTAEVRPVTANGVPDEAVFAALTLCVAACSGEPELQNESQQESQQEVDEQDDGRHPGHAPDLAGEAQLPDMAA